MTLDNPLRVLVEIQAPNVLGDLMNEMREWLDREKIRSVDFKPAPKPVVGFEIAFRKAEEAERFRERFGGGLRPS